MGVLDLFKKKGKQIDLPPPPPPELLKLNIELPKDDLELPPLPELPPIPTPETETGTVNKKYEIPHLDTDKEFSIPLEVMPTKTEESLNSNENQEPINLPEPKVKREKGPLFIKVDDYRIVLENINLVRNKLSESDYVVEALNELRNKVNDEFERWREDLEEMQRKVVYMDKALFEGK